MLSFKKEKRRLKDKDRVASSFSMRKNRFFKRDDEREVERRKRKKGISRDRGRSLVSDSSFI